MERGANTHLWLFEVEFLIKLSRQSRLEIAEEVLIGVSAETHGSERDIYVHQTLLYYVNERIPKSDESLDKALVKVLILQH